MAAALEDRIQRKCRVASGNILTALSTKRSPGRPVPEPGRSSGRYRCAREHPDRQYQLNALAGQAGLTMAAQAPIGSMGRTAMTDQRPRRRRYYDRRTVAATHSSSTQAGDEVIETLNNGTDTVSSSINYTLGTNVEKLILHGNGPQGHRQRAQQYDYRQRVEQLPARRKRQRYTAGRRRKRQPAGRHRQGTLSGGAGPDLFFFRTLAEAGFGAGRDVITDFRHSHGDKINLKGIDANAISVATEPSRLSEAPDSPARPQNCARRKSIGRERPTTGRWWPAMSTVTVRRTS